MLTEFEKVRYCWFGFALATKFDFHESMVVFISVRNEAAISGNVEQTKQHKTICIFVVTPIYANLY